MNETSFDAILCQINTKRHWPKAAKRMIKMLRSAEKRGATILTLNEISKEQAEVIKALPGWDIFWTINDRLRGGNWAGNAVAWKVDNWTREKGYAREVEIDYRAAKKFSPIKGPWKKKTIKFACVELTSVENVAHAISIQAFHYPTPFNSNEKSRQKCVVSSSQWAEARMENGDKVALGGDGNNVFPEIEGLGSKNREGPDGVITNGRCRQAVTLFFKKLLLSDHNGLLVTIRFS